MTKTDEINVWRKLCAALDPDSTYTGRWAREQMANIEAAMQADIEPDTMCLSVVDAKWVAEALRESAKKEAALILERAEREALATAARAQKEVAENAQQLAYLARKAAREMNDLASRYI